MAISTIVIPYFEQHSLIYLDNVWFIEFLDKFCIKYVIWKLRSSSQQNVQNYLA